MVGTARLPIRPHPATSGDAADAPEKRKVEGSGRPRRLDLISDAQTRELRGDMLIQATPVGLDATATPVQAGPCRLFVGKRSDPFFADADGVLHWLIDGATGGYQWTGKDSFAGTNISPSRWRYQMTCSARAGHRGVDYDQVAPRRRACAHGPGRQPVVQPDPQPQRHQRRVQRH
jgi:hypothetical protein